MTAIHICALNTVEGLAAEIRPSHVLSLLAGPTEFPATPNGIDPAQHLKLKLADIAEPQEGLITPGEDHVRDVIDFAKHWADNNGGTQPVLVHCYAGISRSTASALTIACTLRPDVDEAVFTQALRRASASAQPNPLIIAHADKLLERNGRLIAAVMAMGEGDMTQAGKPFVLHLDV